MNAAGFMRAARDPGAAKGITEPAPGTLRAPVFSGWGRRLHRPPPLLDSGAGADDTKPYG